MNIFSNWNFNDISLKFNKLEFKQEQYYISLSVLQIFAVLLILAELVLLVIVNYPKQPNVVEQGFVYRNYLYAIIIVVESIFLFMVRVNNPKLPEDITLYHQILIICNTIFMVCWAASMSSVDQIIHGDITVYIIGCFAVAASLRFAPFQFLLVYAISFSVFIFGMIQFQTNIDKLIAHYINGSVLVIMAFVVSIILHRMRVRDFISRKTVEQQKSEMEQRVIERTADLATANEELKAEVIERKAAEEKMAYFSLHDALTGLYNRTYFEEEMRRLSNDRVGNVGLIMCDVDGLKLINDSMGHDNGDSLLLATANLIKSCFRNTDVVARVGGDEFAILIPNCTPEILESAYNRLQESANQSDLSWQGMPLSLSVGVAMRTNPSVLLSDIYKEADNNMYRQKLYRSQSARSAIVQTLMKALEARDFITEGHAERLQVMVAELGAKLGLTGRNIVDLRLFAQFHDIGKVGLPDRILFKPEPLTPEERKEMQRHSEMGHRIALSAPDLVHIADWILKHHEWWNGSGYPLGLEKEDIPLECRILAVADAYDAMTSNRPYREALPRATAVAELERCAGIQFDPYLIKQFVEMVEQQQ